MRRAGRRLRDSDPNYRSRTAAREIARAVPRVSLASERARARRLRLRGADLFADLEAGEAAHHDVFLDDGDLLLDDLADRLLGLADVRLLEQAEGGVVLLELPLGDLLDDVGRLARCRGQ